jgi:hypothetical protein
MANDGKSLQNLTEFIENALHPVGFKVVTNWCEFDSDGNFLAEFDIQFIGTQMNSGYKWLIECRDRPSHGAAPGAWIEQLVGRRSRFKFDKVTAVSSTGFALGAVEYAATENIELKQVRSLTPQDFASWLLLEHVEVMEPNWKITNVVFVTAAGIEPSLADALNLILSDHASNGRQSEPLLKGKSTGVSRSLNDLFFQGTRELGDWQKLVPNDSPKSVKVILNLSRPGNVFVIETSKGPVQIERISMSGDIWLAQALVPISKSLEYRRNNAPGFIGQSATFGPHDDGKTKITFEMHHIPGSGSNYVVVHQEPSAKT